jgi:hypothetical protein
VKNRDRVRSEVLTAVKISMLVFYVVTPCGYFPEDGDSMFYRNVGIYLQVHTASQPGTETQSEDVRESEK